MNELVLTNNQNIPLALTVWLCKDEYDHNNDPNTISATSLIKPVRQFILNEKLPNSEIDISSLIASRMGTAIHNSAEDSWKDLDNVKKAFKLHGYPNKFINRVKVNPSKEELEPDTIAVYLEQRVSKQIEEFTVSGKFDMVLNGTLYDYKSTSVYTYINDSNAQKYIEQASIYRYLNPDIITEDSINIEYIFTDWSRASAYSNKNYPTSRVKEVSYPLMSLNETERFIKNKLNDIRKFRNASNSAIPLCSDSDLWIEPTKYKYYKDSSKLVRSTKNFDDSASAYKHLSEQNTGIVLEVKGKAKACNYCNARAICTQYEQLQEEGRI